MNQPHDLHSTRPKTAVTTTTGMGTWTRCLWRLSLIFAAALVALPAFEVREVRWGFDGTVVLERFNPVAVLVAEPGPLPFEGMAELRAGNFSSSGAPYVQPVYLAGGTTRWLRFTPWIGRYPDNFTLKWPDGSHDLGQPRAGRLATVAVGDGLPAPQGAVAVLPAELFPASVVAWEGLGALALDHDPAWTADQRAACAAWVRGGGVLHLFTGRDGRPAHLGAGLADLAGDAGAGNVQRVTAALGASRTLLKADPPTEAPESHSGANISAIQQSFGSVVQGKHNWPVISSMLGIYVLVLALVPWWLGRRRRSWQMVYGVILGLIAVTTVGLAWIGRRGYGESAVTRTVSVAHHVGGDRYAVTTFGSSFVVTSGRLTVAHGAGGDLYACPVEHEQVEGAILAGPEARLSASVPLFTTQHWAHAATRSGPATPTLSEEPEGWKITLPSGLVVERGWLALPTGVVEMHTYGAGFIGAARTTPTPYKNLDHSSPAWSSEDVASVWRAVGPLALAWSLGPAYGAGELVHAPAPGCSAIFLLATQPPAWQAPGLGAQEGRVLYRYDLPRSAP